MKLPDRTACVRTPATKQPEQAAMGSNDDVSKAWASLFKARQADWRNATDCTPATSKRLRQRMFLHATISSFLTMYDWALAKRARSRSSALRGSDGRLRRTSQAS